MRVPLPGLLCLVGLFHVSFSVKLSNISNILSAASLQSGLPAEPAFTPFPVDGDTAFPSSAYTSAPVPSDDGFIHIRLIFGDQASELAYPRAFLSSLSSVGHVNITVWEQRDLVRQVLDSIGSISTSSTRALEELFPASAFVKQRHLELIMEERPAEGRGTLLRQLYLDMKQTDDVSTLATVACGELGYPTPECLQYVSSEISGTLSVSDDDLGAPVVFPDSYVPKAHYTNYQVPACVLLREGFNTERVAASPTVASSPPRQHSPPAVWIPKSVPTVVSGKHFPS